MKSVHAAKLADYAAALHVLSEGDCLRGLKPRAGIDFTSNDYLALASTPRMKEAVLAAVEAGTPLGTGGRGFCAATASSTKVSKQKLLSSLGRKRRFSLAAVMSQT